MKIDDAMVMDLWRRAGLPEYFLGNGGTNERLVLFAQMCRFAPPSDAEELRAVINSKWDYLEIRQKLAKLSGVPCMAITTDAHINEIGLRLRNQEDEIERLKNQIEKIKGALI